MSETTLNEILKKAEAILELRFLSIILACVILTIILILALNIYGTTKEEQMEIKPKESSKP